MSDTLHARPLPPRPKTGLLAWQATVGYLCSEYSPDAMLSLRAGALASGDTTWEGVISWGQQCENVSGVSSLPALLRDLWLEVENKHTIFHTAEAAVRRPALYDEHEWLDAETAHTLKRLLEVIRTAFGLDWMLILLYQPVEDADIRAQARLIAREQAVSISGRGPSMRDACRDLYRNAAPGYFAGKPQDVIFT